MLPDPPRDVRFSPITRERARKLARDPILIIQPTQMFGLSQILGHELKATVRFTTDHSAAVLEPDKPLLLARYRGLAPTPGDYELPEGASIDWWLITTA